MSTVTDKVMPGKPSEVSDYRLLNRDAELMESLEGTENACIREYYMHYRHGMNSKLEKYFKHAGDLVSARKRAQEHCNIMNYRLIWVRPLFIDLAEEEAQQIGHKNGG